MSSHASDRPRNAADYVNDAIQFVESMVKIKAGDDKHGRPHAIASIATGAGVSRSAVRALLQPSRRPKQIAADQWARLRGHYLRLCRSQLDDLQAEIRRIEALGLHDAADRRLVDEAKATLERLHALL